MAEKTQVDLFVKATSVKDANGGRPASPFMELHINCRQTNAWKLLSRNAARASPDSRDIHFSFLVDFEFEEVQLLKFLILDGADRGDALELGHTTASLSEVFGSKGQTLSKRLEHGPSASRDSIIVIEGREISSAKEFVHLHFAAKRIDNVDGLFGKSDPYLILKRCEEDGAFKEVWRTETIMNNLSPTWNPFKLSMYQMCSGERGRPILIECWDWEKSGCPQYIGSVHTTLAELSSGPEREFLIINEKKKAKREKKHKKYISSGILCLLSWKMEIETTFLDYIRSGWEINFLVAIDYTASNLDPNLVQSLHYFNPLKPNAYQSAIISVGEILSNYDRDKKFPVMGFGAKIDGVLNPCFPLTFNSESTEVNGVDGLLMAYRTAFQRVKLSGPTVFQPIISFAANYASQHFDSALNRKYSVLLILTDGAIHDMQQTVDCIVEACDLPVSILIVGIGDADFGDMVTLDADDKPLVATTGKQAARDIVQFVPLRDLGCDTAKLAKELLREIPSQMLSYFRMKGLAADGSQN